MKGVVTSELVIHAIITHGPQGAANGVITTEEGKSFAFCGIYRYASASGKKVESMTSFFVDLSSGD